MDIDSILPAIGEYGRYQKIQFALLCVPAGIGAALIAFHSSFVSASPDHWCSVPSFDSNLTDSQLRTLTIPKSINDVDEFDHCRVYDVDFQQYFKNYSGLWPPEPRDDWKTIKCNKWKYDKSVFDETLVTKFNLVCDKDWLPPFSKSMFYLGSFFGNFMFGYISDRYGRRKAMVSIIVWMVVFSVGSAFPVNYYMYVALRFLIGFSFPSSYQIPFVSAIELMAPEKRTMVGNVIACVFATGLAILGFLGYVTRNWFDLILASSLPFAALVAYWWLIPESPRWLFSRNRLLEAEAILWKAAKMNGKNLPPNFLRLEMNRNKHYEEIHITQMPSLWELFKTPNMRKKILITAFCWSINAVVYTVLSFQASGLGVNEYLGLVISGLVEIPAYFLIWILMDKIGRRWSIFGTMLLGGVACIITLFLPESMVWVILSLAMIGKIGIAASFSVIYVFAGELNPTIIRSTAIGLNASVAAICLIGAPYLLYLTKYGRTIPLVICGVLSVLGAISIIFLPETLYCPLPQTLDEGEEFGNDFKILSYPKKIITRRLSMRLSDKKEDRKRSLCVEPENGNIMYTSSL